ncbi:MAG: hypothetical protein JO115_15700 [Pseudonocardiales bacterium]|nr:hypothetical protein [Pseudonocardiales bacterium]
MLLDGGLTLDDLSSSGRLATGRARAVTEHFAPVAQALGRLHGVRYGEAFAPLPIIGRLPASPHL